MKSLCFSVLVIIFLTQVTDAWAQSRTVIRGNVVDQSTKMPLPGVNIVEIDKQNRIVKGEITDVNGNYTLEVSDTENYIRVSFISFESETFKVNERTHIDIVLKETGMELEEVVIRADASVKTLTGVHERDQTGSTVKVNMEDLSSVAGISAADALQGQIAGLDILASSGDPGSGSSIVIRGMGSLGNNNPLIVVDGIDQNIQTQDLYCNFLEVRFFHVLRGFGSVAGGQI